MYLYTCTYIRVYIHEYNYISGYIYTHMYMQTHVYTYICIYAYVYVYMYKHKYTKICIYIYRYIHTCICMYIIYLFLDILFNKVSAEAVVDSLHSAGHISRHVIFSHRATAVHNEHNMRATSVPDLSLHERERECLL